jgi:predicted nucleotidyltransferase
MKSEPLDVSSLAGRSAHEVRSEIGRAVRPVLERYGVLTGILFGSVARGTQTARSDVDLVLVQRTSKRFLDRYDGILEALYAAVRGADIDVLIYTPEEFSRIADRPFIRDVVGRGACIYES